ncbi:MAG TPA: YqcI/YcgG family protein, partial [Rhodobacterales bacterium]|nr:YqcI/YcgG family protein [Rhodobacterales bacterium]
MSMITQNDLAADRYGGPGWHQDVLHDLADRLTPPSAFPCTFSQNAFRRGLVEFVFVDRLDAGGLSQLRADLGHYIAAAALW